MGPQLAAVAGGLLLNTAVCLVEGIAGEFDDMERVHDFHSIGQLLNRGCLEPGESIHGDDVNAITPDFRTGSQPLFEHLLRPSGHHVEKSCRACQLADWGQVNDHGDVAIAIPGEPLCEWGYLPFESAARGSRRRR